MGAEMSIEAMRLALKALEQHGTPLLNYEDAYAASLTSLRQAIEAAEKQEPAAWITVDGEGFRIRFSPPPTNVPLGWDALYLHPQPKREWVGLTDEEMRQAANAMDAEPLAEGWKELIKFARAIDAKCREKNGC